MKPTIWYTIAATPWWMYFIYVYFIYIGYLALHTKQVPYQHLRKLCIFFLIATVTCLVIAKQTTPKNTLFWLIAFLAGICLGWVQYKIMRIKAIRQTSLIHLPGNWLLLPLLPALIYLQFHYGYNYSTNLINLINHLTLLHWLPPLYGLLAGLFIGKLIYAKHCLQRGPFTQ